MTHTGYEFEDRRDVRISMELAPGYAVGYGTLALINAGIAQGKNRSGLNWFLLSLLLGPLATFILVVLDKLEP